MAVSFCRLLRHHNKLCRNMTSSRFLSDDSDGSSMRTRLDSKCRRLEGRVAVITGSTKGIGLATAERLASEGAKVMISSRSQKSVSTAVERLRAQGYTAHGATCHVGNPDEIIALMDKTVEIYGQLDIAVANAATSVPLSPILEVPDSAWEKIWSVNVKGTYITVREAVKHMEKKKREGSVILMSTTAAYIALPKLGAYITSKAALFALVNNMAEALQGKNIRINCVAPGLYDTKMGRPLLNDEETWSRVENALVIKRTGRIEEAAAMVAFLASDDASYTTGETYVVAGGINTRL